MAQTPEFGIFYSVQVFRVPVSNLPRTTYFSSLHDQTTQIKASYTSVPLIYPAARPTDIILVDQVDHFLNHGYIVIKNAFTERKAAEWTENIWVRMGLDQNDKSTWDRERIHMPSHKREPVALFAPKVGIHLRLIMKQFEHVGRHGGQYRTFLEGKTGLTTSLVLGVIRSLSTSVLINQKTRTIASHRKIWTTGMSTVISLQAIQNILILEPLDELTPRFIISTRQNRPYL